MSDYQPEYQIPDNPSIPEPELPNGELPDGELPPAGPRRVIRDDSIDPNNPYEGAVPPGYDWPTHGGYLGCLFGLMASCIITGFFGSTLFPALAHYNLVPGWVAGLLTLAVFVLLFAGIGRLGYALGKRFLREYPQPTGKTWGEDDDYEPPAPATPEVEDDSEETTETTETRGSGAEVVSPTRDV